MDNKKVKVLHIVEAMGGGVFTYLVELAKGMCDEFDVTIAFGLRQETPTNYEDYFDKKIKLIRVNNFTRGISLKKDGGAYFELRKIIKSMQPDVIHTHSSKAGAIGRLMFTKKCGQMFYTPHGYSFLMENISNKKKKIYKAIEKICGRKDCITVACGQSEWEQSLDVSKKTTFISNGINIEKMDKELKKKKEKPSNHPFTVYTVGRINYQKNPELFNQIAERMPDIRFVWIGDGDMRNQLTSKNITVTGWIHGNGIYDMAKEGDAFLLTSRWEGLPISVLEAMCMKKVCIVSNVLGNRDVIHNGETGYICDNIDEFIEAINQVKNNNSTNLIKNARKEIEEHYNSRNLIDRYKELYMENLQRKNWHNKKKYKKN